jgi:hypothetical protein
MKWNANTFNWRNYYKQYYNYFISIHKNCEDENLPQFKYQRVEYTKF